MNKIIVTILVLLLLVTSCASSANITQTSPAVSSQATVAAPATVEPVTVEPVTVTALTYPIVDTGQGICYDNTTEIPCPSSSSAFYGQDAQYTGNTPRYQDNGDGTVTDLVTGLMWQQDPGQKMTYDQAVANASSFNLAGYADWRLPTIEELYSLILFDGTDVSGCTGTCDATPFIDTRYFHFSYGDESAGERVIDSQWATSTKYVSTTMNGNETMFGVNFADGRIKGYPTTNMFYVLYVRGNPSYGQNNFVDNGDGTITDNATNLTWMQSDSGSGMNWEAALAYCEGSSAAGYDDWRLPNVKELQSIVDYSRSPDTTNSAAIDPIFSVTSITDEAGKTDYPFYWSSTTHVDVNGHDDAATYVALGEALGYMQNAWIDVHGAGAQRSDPKSGSAADYPTGRGPQGDAIRIDNYVRCVRAGNVISTPNGDPNAARPTMQVESSGIMQQDQPGGMPTQGGQGPQGGTPPQEAINACSASVVGAACSFVAPNGTITGTCQSIQQQLACVPVTGP